MMVSCGVSEPYTDTAIEITNPLLQLVKYRTNFQYNLQCGKPDIAWVIMNS